MASPFAFDSYVEYLRAVFTREATAPKRKDLCQFLGCQPSFFSQVLTGRSHLSPEHAVLIARFLKLQPDEKRYFLLLVQAARAGTDELRIFYAEQMLREKKTRESIKEHLNVSEELSREDQAHYYSQWWYAAIHILTSFPEIKTADDICQRLRLNKKVVREAVEFLSSRKLITKDAGGFGIGKTRVHLGSRSPFIARHHMNWRAKAHEALERGNGNDIHYSSVIGISRKGAVKVRSAIMGLLKDSEEVVRTTPEEAPFVFLVDFFEL